MLTVFRSAHAVQRCGYCLAHLLFWDRPWVSLTRYSPWAQRPGCRPGRSS